MGGALSKAGGFVYFWPLIFLAANAVWVCIAFIGPESNGGVLTDGGKRLARSRVFLGVGCAIDYLCVAIGVAFRSGDSNEPMLVLGFWDNHWHVFLALILSADVSMLIAMVCALRGRGSRSWIIQIATVIVVISSTFVTLLFLFPG